MIIRIPTRAISSKEREKETDFILIGENRLTTDFSCEDVAKAVAYIILEHMCNGIQEELERVMQEFYSIRDYEELERFIEMLKSYAEKFEVK